MLFTPDGQPVISYPVSGRWYPIRRHPLGIGVQVAVSGGKWVDVQTHEQFLKAVTGRAPGPRPSNLHAREALLGFRAEQRRVEEQARREAADAQALRDQNWAHFGDPQVAQAAWLATRAAPTAPAVQVGDVLFTPGSRRRTGGLVRDVAGVTVSVQITATRTVQVDARLLDLAHESDDARVWTYAPNPLGLTGPG